MNNFKITVDKNGMVGEGVRFERIRRITGYLSDTTKWCNSKKCELRERVKHGLNYN